MKTWPRRRDDQFEIDYPTSPEAFDHLHRLTRAPLFKYCRMVLQDAEATDEAAQLTYSHAWELLNTHPGETCYQNGAILTFRPPPITLSAAQPPPSQAAPLRAYIRLYRLADLHIDRLRKRYLFDTTRRTDLDHLRGLPDPNPTPDASAERRQLIHMLHTSIDKLPPPCAHVLRLYYFNALSHEQIARQLAIDRSTVTKRLHRGLALLHSHLMQNTAPSALKHRPR